MSNATHREQPDGEGESHSGWVRTRVDRLRRAAAEQPMEFSVRLASGVIGLVLIVMTVHHITQPPLAADAVELIGSAAGQWLAVALFAVLLLVSAVSGPTI